ncbi:MAG: hypothetical protein IJG67_09265 [Oscillospiraceae bacterium]|nr:hypothetical protein [Oscillospiraceae bacterium]
MTESKEKLDNTAVEEMMRRNMPVLDVPQSLSPETVAANLESSRKIRNTPIYIIVRTAVAAVLTMAVGIGAIYVVRGGTGKGRAKEASDIFMETDGYPSEESFSYSTETKPSDVSESKDGGLSTNGSYEEPVQDGTEHFDADKERVFSVQMATGEERIIDTDIAYSEALEIRMAYDANENARETETCLINIRESTLGTAEIYIMALEEGDISFELLNGEDPVMMADITVTE